MHTFSSMTFARMTSFLWMGPMAMEETGMGSFWDRRNSRSASRDPSVLACTQTPSPAHQGCCAEQDTCCQFLLTETHNADEPLIVRKLCV